MYVQKKRTEKNQLCFLLAFELLKKNVTCYEISFSFLFDSRKRKTLLHVFFPKKTTNGRVLFTNFEAFQLHSDVSNVDVFLLMDCSCV